MSSSMAHIDFALFGSIVIHDINTHLLLKDGTFNIQTSNWLALLRPSNMGLVLPGQIPPTANTYTPSSITPVCFFPFVLRNVAQISFLPHLTLHVTSLLGFVTGHKQQPSSYISLAHGRASEHPTLHCPSFCPRFCLLCGQAFFDHGSQIASSACFPPQCQEGISYPLQLLSPALLPVGPP